MSKLSELIPTGNSINTEDRAYVQVKDLVGQKITIDDVSLYVKDGIEKVLIAFDGDQYTVTSGSAVVGTIKRLQELDIDIPAARIECGFVVRRSKKNGKEYYDLE